MPTNPYKNTEQVNAVIKVRRGPEVDRVQVTYEDGELIYSTDKKRLFVGDGVGDEGTDGGNLVGNRLWISNSFNSASLPYIEKYDLVYRPITTGFYILTGDSIVDPASYLLVGGKELIPQVSTYTIPKASNSILGGVIVKTGLTVDVNGNLNLDYDSNTLTMVGNKLSVIPGVGGTTGTIGNASYAGYGKVRIVENTGLNIDNGNLSVSIDSRTIKISSVAGADQLYVDSAEIEITNLPKATSSELGAIMVSDGLKINAGTGQLSLKTATDNFIGGVKTGKALSASTSNSELDVITDNVTMKVNGQNQLEVNYPIAINGDVLTYNNTTNTWTASAVPASGGNGGGGIAIFDTPGTFSWTAPAGCNRITVELYGGGGGCDDTMGGAGSDGGDTICSINGISITAGGGKKTAGGSSSVGGVGGTVNMVAANPTKGFSGVGQGNGGIAGGTDNGFGGELPAGVGTGSNGGYGGGGGGGGNNNRACGGGGCGTGSGGLSLDVVGRANFGARGGGGVGGGCGGHSSEKYPGLYGGGAGQSGGTTNKNTGGGGGGHAVYTINVTPNTTYTNSIVVGAGGNAHYLSGYPSAIIRIPAGGGAVIIRY